MSATEESPDLKWNLGKVAFIVETVIGLCATIQFNMSNPRMQELIAKRRETFKARGLIPDNPDRGILRDHCLLLAEELCGSEQRKLDSPEFGEELTNRVFIILELLGNMPDAFSKDGRLPLQ